MQMIKTSLSPSTTNDKNLVEREKRVMQIKIE
jgi:hypothetical protein